MRHGKTINHLGRTYSHRKAMLNNMACSLIIQKRIFTTTAKAKELRKFVEPLLTRSKPQNDTMHSRRTVFSYLQDKEAVKELFDVVGEKIAERPGGYTRIIKIGTRLGDNADMCMIELVDFNDVYGVQEETKTKTRRSRRGSGAKSGVAAAVATSSIEDAVIVDDSTEEETVVAHEANEVSDESVAFEEVAETEEVIEAASAEEIHAAEEVIEEAPVVETTTEEPAAETPSTDEPAADTEEEKKAE